MVELGPPATIERVASGNSRPKTVRACALLNRFRHAPMVAAGVTVVNYATKPPSRSIAPSTVTHWVIPISGVLHRSLHCAGLIAAQQ
jgi:hypothetical protein